MRLIPFTRETSPAIRPAFSDLDRLFESLWQDSALPAANYVPRLDLRESADAVSVQIDLPGVDKKDVQVTLQDGLLTISGKREAVREEKNDTWHRTERVWGSFERHVRLGDGVNADQVKAELKDGVLNVTVPKKETAKARTIDIV